jgi:hypothetical protein
MITCSRTRRASRLPVRAKNAATGSLRVLSITLFRALPMEPSVGSKKPVYGMLMTVLFTPPASYAACAPRLARHAHAHSRHLTYHRAILPPFPRPLQPRSSFSRCGGVVEEAGDTAGLLFKLVHTAAGHDLLVPVPVPASMYHISAVARRAPAGQAGPSPDSLSLRPLSARAASRRTVISSSV